MKLLAEPILNLEEAYPSGRIYPFSEGEYAIKQINATADFFLGDYNGKTWPQNVENISGRVSNARIEHNKILVDIDLLDTDAGRLIKMLYERGLKMSYALSMRGHTTNAVHHETGEKVSVVSQIVCIGVYVCPNPKSQKDFLAS